MIGLRPVPRACLGLAVLATTAGVPANRSAFEVRAADDLTPGRRLRRDLASLSLDKFDQRKLQGRLAVDKKDFPGGITLSYRGLNSAQVVLLPAGPMSEGSNLIPVSFPAPWKGELRIADARAPQRSTFVAVAVEPVVPNPRPDFVYGPSGRAQVLLPARVPAELKYLVFISPGSAPVPDGLIDDPVQVGCLPTSVRVKEAVVGLTPLAPPGGKAMALSVLESGGGWRALHSHTAPTGTVFARGPVPGTYAVTVQP